MRRISSVLGLRQAFIQMIAIGEKMDALIYQADPTTRGVGLFAHVRGHATEYIGMVEQIVDGVVVAVAKFFEQIAAEDHDAQAALPSGGRAKAEAAGAWLVGSPPMRVIPSTPWATASSSWRRCSASGVGVRSSKGSISGLQQPEQQQRGSPETTTQTARPGLRPR
jgi:hypothetical protein